MLGSVKVLVGKDDSRNYRGAHFKRTTVTAIERINTDGRYLNPMIIWPAATHRSNWTTFRTPRTRAGCRPRVLICDGVGTHETLEMLEFCFVILFAPLKAAYRDCVEHMEEHASTGLTSIQLLLTIKRRRCILRSDDPATNAPGTPPEVSRSSRSAGTHVVLMARANRSKFCRTHAMESADHTNILRVLVDYGTRKIADSVRITSRTKDRSSSAHDWYEQPPGI
ncbi:hypothetical protein MRB53_041947 [Persea americana]|nr:hypothetical protein MRB53_041947 [Persea americana]